MTKQFKSCTSILLRGWLGSLLIALLIATSFKSAIADWYVVPTGSMNPTILEGDRIFANKLAYDLKVPYTTFHLASWDNPGRGEIVVFLSPTDGTRLVKRVVAVPGDTIAMLNNRLFINGEPLNYDLSDRKNIDPDLSGDGDKQFYSEDLTGHRHMTMIMPGRLAMRSFAPVAVPEHHYFMMGDNRDNSADSRYFGFVERSAILGRASAVVISLNIEDRYQPRWSRFLTKLQ